MGSKTGGVKSTLMKIMSGVYKCDEGRIFIEGSEVHRFGVESAGALESALFSGTEPLCPHMSVADNIFIGRPAVKHGLIDKTGQCTKKHRRYWIILAST